MKLSREIIVNASADAVWKVLAHEFGSVGEWASGVAHSVANHALAIPEGATVGGRVCQVPGFGELNESFTAYDEQGKTYTFEAKGLPFIVRAAHNTWRVQPLGNDKCRVSFAAEMQLMPVVGLLAAVPMRVQLGTLLKNAVEELKYYVETGSIHPRKLQ
ncbi:MAG: SRPBCC family protein, partial [Anaerolineae bacterium]|nr:SRPBCC family protein [Anaerolineae bacterium]